MLNIIMMVPDSLSTEEAVNSPVWADPNSDEQRLSAAKQKIGTTRQLNRCSDEQIVKFKRLMSKGKQSQKFRDHPLEPA